MGFSASFLKPVLDHPVLMAGTVSVHVEWFLPKQRLEKVVMPQRYHSWAQECPSPQNSPLSGCLKTVCITIAPLPNEVITATTVSWICTRICNLQNTFTSLFTHPRASPVRKLAFPHLTDETLQEVPARSLTHRAGRGGSELHPCSTGAQTCQLA